MTPEQLEKIKKILPSKKFTKIIALCAAGVIIFIITTSFFGAKSGFSRTKPVIPLNEGDTLGDVMGRDTNKNGITDWEESLWGLDPTGDGPANKKIIDDKKLAAGITPSTDTDPGESLTPTDQFAQEFLSSILALRQAGSLTPDAVGKVAESIGQSLDSKRVLTISYTVADQTLLTTSGAQAKNTYKTKLKTLVDQYDKLGIGTELSILGDNVSSDDEQALSQLEPIATAYTDFSKKVITLPVPKEIAPDILSLANASAQMGRALVQASKIHTDIISGMVGIDDYVKASALFDAATSKLADYFSA